MYTFYGKVLGNTVNSPGIDWGPKGIKILESKPPYFMARWGAHTFWSGGRDYQPAVYIVLRQVDDKQLQVVFEKESTRATRRAVIAEVKEQFEKLANSPQPKC